MNLRNHPGRDLQSRFLFSALWECVPGALNKTWEDTARKEQKPARGKYRREESLGYKLIDGLSPRSGRSERCRLFAEVEHYHFIGVGGDQVLPSQTVPAALKISYRLSSPFSSLFYCTVTTPIVVRGPDPTRNDHKTP